MMTIAQGVFLGLIQGLAEFLPISSSGHLNLFQALIGVETEQPLLFNLLLHAATLAAVGVVFRRDWADMLLHPVRNRTPLLLLLASLPALAAKLLLDQPLTYLETHNTWLGVCFLLTGLMLALTQLASRRNVKSGLEKATVGAGEALTMGCLQAVGLLPGVSRSGSTIFGGVSAGLSREAAAKFSFLMSAPAIVGGLLSEGKAGLETGAAFGGDLPAVLAGMLTAFISGYLSIRFFLRLVSRASLNGFALYMTLLGLGVIALQLAGVLTDAPMRTAEGIGLEFSFSLG